MSGRLLTLLLAAFLLSAGPLSAQRFGRWWWDGELGLGFRGQENRLDGSRLNRVEQQELKLSLGVNGYVFHPAVGRFRLGLDLLLSEFEGGRSVDTDRLGGEGRLHLFPRGNYPLELFFRRQLYDYTGLATGGSPSLLGVPDTFTRWGGRFRAKRGLLKGTLAGFEHTGYDLLAPRSGRDVEERQFVVWTGAAGGLQHRLRLEHRQRDFGTVDLGIDDLTLTLDQRGDLSAHWRWELFGSGIRRSSELAGGAELASDSYTLRNRLSRPLRERDLLDLRYTLGLTESDGATNESQAVSASYRWRPRQAWEIAPFGQLVRQSGPRFELTSPRLGVQASWTRRGKLETQLSGTTSYGSFERRDGEQTDDESELALSLTASLVHGDDRRLRKEVELELVRNELRLSPGLAIGLPDLGLPRAALGAEERARIRISLNHRWDSRWVSSYGEWSRRDSSEAMRLGAFEAETLNGNLQLGGTAFNLQANVGETRVRQLETGPQDARFVSLDGLWRPLRILSLRALYRADERDFLFLPSIDTDQLEVRLELEAGLLEIEVRGFETSQSVAGGQARTSEGLIVSVTRRFAGWLPMVTGTQRRGVIR